jgi:hypothetical protein
MPIPSAPYIPPRDADFDAWFNNLNTLITATPAAYGLVAGDAVIIDAQWDIWHPAYLLLTNPATKTSPNVAAKDVARVNAESVLRPYCQRIRANAGVSDALKVGLGLNLQPTTLTPIPAPGTVPVLSQRAATAGQMVLSYHDSVLSGKAKPYGSIGIEIFVNYGASPNTDPSQAAFHSRVTKSPCTITWPVDQRGKVATIFGRYVTRGGPSGISQNGPWSDPLPVTVT